MSKNGTAPLWVEIMQRQSTQLCFRLTMNVFGNQISLLVNSHNNEVVKGYHNFHTITRTAPATSPSAVACNLIIPLFFPFKGRKIASACPWYVLHTLLLKLSISEGQAFPEPAISPIPDIVNVTGIAASGIRLPSASVTSIFT